MASKRRERARERTLKALQLRARGKNYTEIAKELGYANASGAYNAINRTLNRNVKEASEQVREIELTRLDTMINSVWDKVLDGNVKAGEYVLKIMDRRSKYLGLDTQKEQEKEIKVEFVNDWRGKPGGLEDVAGSQEPGNTG